MAAITGNALKSKLESMMATYVDKKNTYLNIGKGVASINKKLKALYNYWVITDQCDLTESEINCIVKDVGVICNVVTPIVLDTKTDIVPTEPRYASLRGFYENCTHTYASKGNSPLGSATITAGMYGGAGGYSYQWSVFKPNGCTKGEAEYTYFVESGAFPLSLSNATTNTVTVGNIAYRVGFVLRCVITDSNGSTITLEKQFHSTEKAPKCGFPPEAESCQ